MQSTTVYLDPDIKEGLRQLKESEQVNVAEFIRRAIRDALARRWAEIARSKFDGGPSAGG